MFPFENPEKRKEATALSIEGSARWRATAPRCVATNRFGQPCGAIPIKGMDRCAAHGGHAAGVARRKGILPDTPLKAHRRLIRQAWSKNPWTEGWGVSLPPDAEAALVEALDSEGIRLAWIAPADADWARWRFVKLHQFGDVDAGWNRLVDGLRERMMNTGMPPETAPPDYRIESARVVPVARVKRKPGSRWTPRRKGRGKAATVAAREAEQAKRWAEYAAIATAWRPADGQPLTPWERRQLKLAREKDEREGHGKHRLEEACQRAIEGSRLRREREAQMARERDIQQMRAQLAAAQLQRHQKFELQRVEIAEDGQAVQTGRTVPRRDGMRSASDRGGGARHDGF